MDRWPRKLGIVLGILFIIGFFWLVWSGLEYFTISLFGAKVAGYIDKIIGFGILALWVTYIMDKINSRLNKIEQDIQDIKYGKN
jgi:hypothetical protein